MQILPEQRENDMNEKVTFTDHGLWRSGRTKLLTEEVAAILCNPNQYINVGKDAKSNRVHKLFYSKRDRLFLSQCRTKKMERW